MSTVTEPPDQVQPEQTRKIAETMAAAQKSYEEMMTAGFEQSRQKYEQAQQAYTQELQGLYGELAERSQNAYKAYNESLASAITSAPSYEAFVAAWRAYVERFQKLFGGSEMNERAQAAYNEYLTRVTAHPEGATAATEGAFLRSKLEEIWKQESLQQELQAAQAHYVAQLERLSEDGQQRQTQAYLDLLAALSDIWSKPDLAARTQGALNRFSGAVREVVIDSHATVEKSSATAVAKLSDAGATKP